MAIAQARREQHGPELVAAEEHHHPLARPEAIAPRPEQQPPKGAGRQDPVKQAHPCRHLVFAASGIGAGHQDQIQGTIGVWVKGPQGQLPVQAQGQGPHPGAEFARAVANQHNSASGT